jgi:hypothetical protein
MRFLRFLAVFVVLLSVGTTAFYAVQQQKSLKSARLAAEALEKERNELRKKLWDAQKRIGDLEAASRNVAGRGPNGEEGGPPPSPDVAMMEAALRSGEGPGGFARIFALLDNPEFQKLATVQQRAALDSRYAALFRGLNLSPAQLDQFKNLLVEKRTAVADVMAAARDQGLNGRENRDELRALVQNAQSEVDANIRSLLGEAGYQQYQQFEKTQPQRAVVGQLEQRLSYSGQPLTPEQSEQLVQVLATNPSDQPRAQRAPEIRTPAGRIGFAGGGGTPISDQAVAQAATVLSAPQVQALQQIQQEQQAQAALSQLVREQMGNRRGKGNNPPAQPASPPKG